MLMEDIPTDQSRINIDFFQFLSVVFPANADPHASCWPRAHHEYHTICSTRASILRGFRRPLEDRSIGWTE